MSILETLIKITSPSELSMENDMKLKLRGKRIFTALEATQLNYWGSKS